MKITKIKAWDYTKGWGSIEKQVTDELNEYVEELEKNNINYDIVITSKKNGAIYNVITKI